MRLVDVAEFYTDQGGGVKTYINQKLELGSRAGHEVIIIAPGKEDWAEERRGGRIEWIKSPPLPLDPRYRILWNKKEVHRRLFQLQPDLVEGSSLWTGGSFAGSWPGNAVKTMIYHQDPVAVYPETLFGKWAGYDRVNRASKPFWHYIRKLSQEFDATITSGEWLRQRLADQGICRPVAIPFGIDKSFFSPHHRDESLRKKWLERMGLDEHAFLLLSVSRHHPEKRIGTLLEGFEEASNVRRMGLILVGNGPIQFWVKRKASGISNVRLISSTDTREDLARLMASSDLLIHGSASETFGLVVAESLCSGLPIVVPDRGGAVDFASPEFAEVYRAGDAGDLSRSILDALESDLDKRRKAAHSYAEKQISTVEEHFDALFSFYIDLLNEVKLG